MKWIIPKRCRPEAVPASDFNSFLPENEGGVCVVDGMNGAGQHEADEDIRKGRVKRFDNPDDMISSLKQPW